MSGHDVVRRLLIERGCPDDLVHGGLPGLIDRWDAIVSSVEHGYAFGLDDFLNDMDLRDTIAAAMAVAMPEERSTVQPRLAALDERLRAASDRSPCLWGEDVEADDGLDPGREWWYYLRPAQLNDEMADELAAWGLLDTRPASDDHPKGETA